jgi:hypothetical protein
MYWLSGNPGAGKSTIAATICHDLPQYLAARFFFNLLADPTDVFKSLAFQLSRFNRPARTAICSALRNEPHICDGVTEDQVTKLFVDPLKAASRSDPKSPILIVIDAFDEISNRQSRQYDILEQVISTAKLLPRNVKILVTSRPEPDITAAFKVNADVQRYHISIDDAEAEKDIKAYIQWKMEFIVERFNKVHEEKLTLSWPGEEEVSKLCTRASGLFVWAATATSFIRDQLDRYGTQRTQAVFDLLNKGEMANIDELYKNLLQQVYRDSDWQDQDYVAFRQVIGALVTLERSLNLRELQRLLFGPTQDFDLPNFVRRLQPVLVLDSNEVPTGDTLPRMHLSFVEFILRCKDSRFRVRKDNAHSYLAQRCLVQLHTLRYNICDIPDFGTKSNEDVPDLHARITRHVPEHLIYASQFWGFHLRSSTVEGKLAEEGLYEPVDNSEIRALVNTFFECHLLHLMEVSSLIAHRHGPGYHPDWTITRWRNPWWTQVRHARAWIEVCIAK